MSIMLKSELKNSSKVIAQLTGKPAPKLQVLLRELYQVWSANPAFLSIIACSPTLNGDIPAEFNANNVQIGALMPTPQQQQGSEFGGEQEKLLEDFLAAGSAPVYFGYGSLICGSSKFMCLLSLRALKKTGERGILVSSWSTMSEADILGEPDAEELKAYCAEKVLFMKTAPHGRLFPRCKVCVHHGGAGTFNSSARSGTPTVIWPIVQQGCSFSRAHGGADDVVVWGGCSLQAFDSFCISDHLTVRSLRPSSWISMIIQTC